MSRILVIRLSAMGDVAMTIPVLFSLATQYPKHHFTLLTRAQWQPLFEQLPANVDFFGVDLKGRHKGTFGLLRLYGELRKCGFNYVADFHDVLRTKFLRLLFRLGGVRVATIDKGRAEKRRLVRREHKVMKPLKTSFQRYTDVMGRLGFPVTLNFTSIYGSGKGDLMEITSFVGEKGDCKWIGIAPFAKHEGKIYPIELQEQVVAHFAVRPDLRIFLFGGGEKEQETFDGWSNKYPSVISLGRTLTMGQELALISHLDVMLSMDSANMHLASLTGVPVVSIWGATHPYAGFMGWNQSADNAIQSDLPCRPCSVFGNKPCWQEKTYACLHSITPSQVIGKIEALIKEE